MSSLLIGDLRCKAIRPLGHERSKNSSIKGIQLPFVMLSHEQDAAKRNIPFTKVSVRQACIPMQLATPPSYGSLDSSPLTLPMQS